MATEQVQRAPVAETLDDPAPAMMPGLGL